MMTFADLLKNRRAIRDFEDREVPMAIINSILQDATLAPSASNGQPCRFSVVHCRKTIKALSDDSKANLLRDHDENKIKLGPDYVEYLKNDQFNVFYNAPCVIYISGPTSVRSLDVDVALMVSYIMFSATEKGLGTCWIGLGANVRDPKLRAELGIPETCRIVAPIILGYPKAIPQATDRHAPDVLRVITEAG
jgi:nitroreductase